MVHFRPGEVVVCVNAQGVHSTKEDATQSTASETMD